MDANHLARRCNADGVFRLAARCWNGSLTLRRGADDGAPIRLALTDGVAAAADGDLSPGAGHLVIEAPDVVWESLFAAVPPAGCNDLASARHVGLKVRGDEEAYAQHFGALSRVIELIRADRHGPAPADGVLPPHPRGNGSGIDSPVGRYHHVVLGPDGDRHDHRLYVETTGAGIPLLLQHTAGAHGAQWRHLFEDPWITEHFLLVAYDLPFHGKSLPPSTRAWWAEPYRLTTEFLMSVPLAVAEALDLADPVFMGCSIGGLLALDLARYHPERFRAVIGVEPALKVEGKIDAMQNLWHPRIDSGYKAALMEGLMAPGSPEALRKETAFVYAQGWPPAFLGDIHFYVVDHDLRAEAARIDTEQVAVHLMSGEYDWSATPEAGREAHAAIPGSTWTFMPGLGHFPMSENPDAFIGFLRPVLEEILVASAQV